MAKKGQQGRKAPDDWSTWLPTVYPTYFSKPFGEHHAEFWEWVWNIQKGVRPRPFVGIWGRGSGKSTGVEGAVCLLGHKRARKYAWYVRETQDQGDKSIDNIAAMLESDRIFEFDPQLADRAVGKYGRKLAWRRNRLMTASGFTVDAMGLDTAIRGVKAKEQRPDLIILDDIDGRHDTPATTEKKQVTITESIIPAGSDDVAVLAMQNLLIPDGIFARLAGINKETKADYLRDRIVSGPHPAVRNLEYELDEEGLYRIIAGTPLWEGQGLAVAEDQMNTWGLTAFLREAQHEVEATGGMYNHVRFRRCNPEDVPDLIRVVAWVDPAVTSTDKSDSMAIQIDGIAEDGLIYRLFSWEAITSPEDAIKRALRHAYHYRAQYLGIETDQGGDTWQSVFKVARTELIKEEGMAKGYMPHGYVEAKAGAGAGSKIHRGQQMLYDYERGKIVHVRGSHEVLERALKRFPIKPLDLADAAYWGWNDLRNGGFALGIQAEHKSRWTGDRPPSEGSRFKRY